MVLITLINGGKEKEAIKRYTKLHDSNRLSLNIYIT